ncbi:MAG: histidine phosphatase family protein [bacterium]|nr:histidine phosphatase family protein [bacterium]
MKELLLVRHAKSGFKDTDMPDIERPLENRGKNDASLIGKAVRKKGIKPDAVISSPAKRALDTANSIAEHIRYPAEEIRIDATLYDSDAEGIVGMIRGLDDSLNSVMLFGHNPDFYDLAAILIPRTIDKFPTCGIVCITFAVNSWREIAESAGELAFFIYPKQYRDKQ